MTVKILLGDCRDVLRDLPDESVHCVVTSPPYFGLRDYGVGGQIGLEATPDAFVAEMVAVFREVRRVLRSDGTLWLNLGDSYAGSGRGGNPTEASSTLEGSQDHQVASMVKRSRPAEEPHGLKPKDLMGMPWRVAFALQADGWWLRQDIIWSKPNPMPESVTDRCTKAHEYLFLLSKSERYYFDQDAIKEPVALSTVERLSQPNLENQVGSDRVPGKTNGNMKAVGRAHIAGNKSHRGKDLYDSGDERHHTKAGLVDYATKQRSARDNFKRDNSKRAEVMPGQSVGTHRPDREDSSYDLGTRNKRSVWTIATQPFKEAHFATFPPGLVEPCILAGSPENTCGNCGVEIDRRYEKRGASTSGKTLETMQVVRCESDPGPPESSEKFLQQDMCLAMDSAESINDEGVDNNIKGLPDASSEGSSEPDALRLRDGASLSDGGGFRAPSSSDRNRASQRREQTKQPSGKSRTSNKERSRQASKKTDRDDQVSSLCSDGDDLALCPSCGASLCEVGTKPGVVLDCFGGAGTTGLVADRLQRNAILIELNPDYAAMARKRIKGESSLLAEVE